MFLRTSDQKKFAVSIAIFSIQRAVTVRSPPSGVACGQLEHAQRQVENLGC